MSAIKGHQDLQYEAFLANKALNATGLIKFSFGNASVADRSSERIAVKPSGVSYDKLTPADMVVLDFEGNIVGGALRPSTDTPTHLLILRHFANANSVIHTHSPMATAFAQAGVPLKCFGTTHADYFSSDIPVTRALSATEIESAYEHNTGIAIIEAFESVDAFSTPAVLVKSHGPFTWGENWRKAIENAEALEFCAGIAISTLSLDPGLSRIPLILHQKHHMRKNGPNAYYGQST